MSEQPLIDRELAVTSGQRVADAVLAILDRKGTARSEHEAIRHLDHAIRYAITGDGEYGLDEEPEDDGEPPPWSELCRMRQSGALVRNVHPDGRECIQWDDRWWIADPFAAPEVDRATECPDGGHGEAVEVRTHGYPSRDDLRTPGLPVIGNSTGLNCLMAWGKWWQVHDDGVQPCPHDPWDDQHDLAVWRGNADGIHPAAWHRHPDQHAEGCTNTDQHQTPGGCAQIVPIRRRPTRLL